MSAIESDATSALAMPDAKTIGYKGLAKIFRGCDSLQGFFPDPKREATWQTPGFQLIAVRRVPITVNGERVGDRLEWHTVQIGGALAPTPLYYMHESMPAAWLVLWQDEIRRAQKEKRTPRIHVKPAMWGGGGERPAHFTVEAGMSCGEHVGEKRGTVYQVGFGSCDWERALMVAGFSIEPAGQYGNKPAWATPEPAQNDFKRAFFNYGFDHEYDLTAE